MTFYAANRSSFFEVEAPCLPLLIERTSQWPSKGTIIELDGVLMGVTLDELRALPKVEPIALTPLKMWTALIEITPRPTLKTTAKGKFSPAAQDYHRYKEAIAKQAKEQGFDRSWVISSIDYQFFMPLPATCFKNGKLTIEGIGRAGQPHEFKPDTQNLQKPILDALARKDETCYEESARKIWSHNDRGYIGLTVHYRPIATKI